MSANSDPGHTLGGVRISRLTLETYELLKEERQETLYNLGHDPGAWLVGALALAEINELEELAIKEGIKPAPDQGVAN